MNYAVITFDGTGCPIAYKLQQEGNKVIVGQILDQKDTLVGEQVKTTKSEDPEKKKKRLNVYGGILKKHPAEDVVKYLQRVPVKERSDWYVFFDSNLCWKYGEQLMPLGFNGNFPTQWDREMEADRAKAKEFVKQYYPEIKVADTQEFKSIIDAIKFLKETDNIYVLKSEGDAGDTIVPTTDDPETAKLQLIDSLKNQKGEYEQGGFIIEQLIPHPVEITPEIFFVDGEPIFTNIDIENKKIGAGNTGPTSGCAQNLVFQTNLEDPINQLAFPPIVYEIAKQRKGSWIWDISLLFDQQGVPYFGEFCSGRPGWDAFPTELSMSGDKNGSKIVTRFFERIVKKQNPFKFLFGSAVKIFNTSKTGAQEGKLITVTPEGEPDTYIYDAVLDGKEWKTDAYEWDLGTITGVGDTIEESADKAYLYVEMLGFLEGYYRPKFDFLSTEYETSIINRYLFGKNLGLYA